jgi:tRNA(fMet)-specific endonuclease VapC
MSYFILDTDHFSLWQRNHPLVVYFVRNHANNTALTIITAEELLRGRLNVIRQASAVSQSDKLVFAYTLFWETLDDLKLLNILKFEQKANEIYQELRRQKIRVGTQDLKIASLALANNSVLVTRNYRDFSQIPNLTLTDWTISE